jgi:hypothetical protein
MNHLLYNISVLMIFVVLISLTYYLAKAYNKNECPKQEVIKKELTIEETYAMKPTQIFDSMFTQPSILQGYESVPVIKTRL